MFYSAKRQQFLLDQGYSFAVKKNIVPPDTKSRLTGRTEELNLLREVLCANIEASSKEEAGGLKATQRLLAEEGGEIEYRMMHQDAGLNSDNRASLRGTQQALKEEGDRQEQEMMAAMTGEKQHWLRSGQS